MSDSMVSKRYARALFSLGQEDGSFNRFGQELEEFTSFFRENPDFGQAISNPIFAVSDRKKVLAVVLDRTDFSNLVKNFLNFAMKSKSLPKNMRHP